MQLATSNTDKPIQPDYHTGVFFVASQPYMEFTHGMEKDDVV